MKRDTAAGFVLGAFVTGTLGVLWYRHWASVPEVRLIEVPPEPETPSLPPHDHWTWASEDEVEKAFEELMEKRISFRRSRTDDPILDDSSLNQLALRPVDRDQWCGEGAAHNAHEKCGGVVALEVDDRPVCADLEPHGSHIWRDVENEGHKRAKPRYCRGRAQGE